MCARARTGVETPFAAPVVPEVKIMMNGASPPTVTASTVPSLAQQVVKAEVTVAAVSADAHDPPRRVGRNVFRRVELGALVAVDDHNLGRRSGQPHRDRRRRERGEQRYVHRAQPPDPQQRDDELLGLAHQHADTITRTDPDVRQRCRAPLGLHPKASIRHVMHGQVWFDDRERHPIGRMIVTQQPGDARIRRGITIPELR